MKSNRSLKAITALALASYTNAFPTVLEALESRDPMVARQQAPDPTTRFNAQEQYVSNTGEHAFVAPDFAAGDQRGPCPGLNAMANHGYLPHNGVGTHLDFIDGTFKTYGMSADLSGFLTVFGGLMEGNGLEWSIGGPSKAVSAPLVGGLLGTPQGISGSHNVYEADNSPGRGDLYQYGNDFELQMTQYQQLYDMGKANGDVIDLPLMVDFRAKRFQQQIENNPYFFNGPFTGVLVQPAAYSFIYRFMSNKSAEHPQGLLNTEILNSFFGVENQNGKLVKNVGHEKIPDNWYKRAIGDEYSIAYLNTDTALAGLKYPQFFSVGGNTGKTNTFTAVDPANLTGGVYNAKTLSQGNNAICFASQFIAQAMPDMLKCSGVLANIEGAMAQFAKPFAAAFDQFSCPKLTSIDDSQFNQFPGYKNLNCKTGTYT